MTVEIGKVRLDKWLWAARFFKTRSLANEAINGGKVHVGGDKVKPSRAVFVGLEISVRVGFMERTVIVRELAEKRGPAKEAVLLYEETAESIARRAHQAQLRQLAQAQREPGQGRPTKKDRRDIHRFTESS